MGRSPIAAPADLIGRNPTALVVLAMLTMLLSRLAVLGPAATAPAPLPEPLNGAGLCILVTAVCTILTLLVWSYWRLLRRPNDPGP